MANIKFIAICTACGSDKDFKYKSKFDRIDKLTFLCQVCRKNKSLQSKIRKCPQCNFDIKYQSPFAKARAEKQNSVCKNCKSNQIPDKFSSFQEEIINGLLLGDGSISHNKRLYPRLSISRQLQDKNYIYWHYKVFKDFYGTEPKYFKSYHNKAKKFYEGYACRTKSGKLFKELQNKWYSKNRKKTIPSDLKITPYTLLIWFLDDGCVVKKSNNNLIIKFSTDGFNKRDVKRLSKILFNDTGAQLNIYKNGNGFILKGSTQVTNKIISLIDPIFLDCMNRKRTWLS